MGDRSGLGCLFSVLRFLGMGAADRSEYPYRRRLFLSAAELLFYGVLVQAVEEEYLVFAKVNVGDLLSVTGKGSAWAAARNRISAKHVDFLLCDREGVRPVLAIELDDASHRRADRVARDGFLGEAFGAAGLGLMRVRAARGYRVGEVRGEILRRVGERPL